MHGRYPHLGFSRTPKNEDKEIVEKAIEDMRLNKYLDKKSSRAFRGTKAKGIYSHGFSPGY